MKIIQGKRKCSIPGALTEGESTRIKYQALAEKDIKTGLAIEAMAAALVFAFLSNKPPIPELINIGNRLMAKIMALAFISTSIAILELITATSGIATKAMRFSFLGSTSNMGQYFTLV